MAATAMKVTPLTPAIGAEISGVDLGAPLDAATEDAIYQALLDHLVIFFRDQEISPERHLAFARSFGEVDAPHPLYAHVPGLKVVIPSTPADAKGLLRSAVEDPDPVLFLEPKKLYRLVKGPYPPGPHRVAIGTAALRRAGSDLTIVP